MAKSIWEQIAVLINERFDVDEIFTQDEIIGAAILDNIVDTTIRSNTWKALLNHNVILAKNDNFFTRNPEYVIETKISSGNHNKENNQDYGKYFELCISEVSKGAIIPPNWDHYKFTEQEKNEVFKHAIAMADYIGRDKILDWEGHKTVSGNGDLIDAEGNIIEIKYLNGDGTGTYFNSTIYGLLKYGFDLRDYLKKHNIYDVLENLFGEYVSISRVNKSPVSQTDPGRKLIASTTNAKPDLYEIYQKQYVPLVEAAMEDMITDVYAYFCTNPAHFAQFIDDMINKRKENEVNVKTTPDRYICFNYYTETIQEIDMNALKTNLQSFESHKTDKGIVINNLLRFNFSWKNSYGLSNPAIYTFINKKGD